MSHQQQMELEFGRTRNFRPMPARQRRLPGARWWFAQMRAVVANATSWRPVPSPETQLRQGMLPIGH